MSETNTGDQLAPIQKAIGDLDKKLENVVGKEELATLQKSLNNAVSEIKVLKDRELEKPGLGLFRDSHEFWTTLAKGWGGDQEAKKLITEEYVKRGNAFLKAPAGQNTMIDSQGGIFVLPEYSAEILQTPPMLANLRQFMRTIPMQTNLYRIRALVDKNHTTSPYGGITVTRGPESGTIAVSKAEWEWIELKPSDVTGMVAVTNDLIQDAPAFASYLPSLMLGAIENREQADFLFGSGGGPLGALSASNQALITVAKETSQTAGTINVTNILKMRARCWDYNDAFWVSAVDNIPQFALMTIGTIPVFMPSAKEGDPFDRLLGRPILYTEHAKATGQLNDLALISGKHYAIGERGQVRSDQSIHVYFTTNETALRFVKRNDGQPLWRAPITPISGNTRSPFINLALRA